MRVDVQPVMGADRRILIGNTAALDGIGLAEEERFPARLEAVLRARGLNARVLVVQDDAALAGALADPAQRPELVVLPATLADAADMEARLKQTGVPVLQARLDHDPAQRPELFQPDGRTLSVVGVEELAVSTRDAVMTALGSVPEALTAPPN